MNRIKKYFAVLLIAIVSTICIFPQTTNSQNSSQKGKIVIVVLDVSGSIRTQFSHITDILDKAIVKDRLKVGDYFVLIPFGDNAMPMYSGQLLRDEDKASISNTLHAMKADNNWTDIGQALHEALNQIVSLKQQDFNLYEPLVLFITDGDITTSPTSPYTHQKVSQIFTDPLISQTPLYNGWYYVGIGKDLHDLPEIAKLSGREDYLLTIEDLNQLEFMLDDWIKNIPESQPLEQGNIIFDNFKLGSYNLKTDKNSTVAIGENILSFRMASTYKRTPVSLEFVSAKGLFQTEDKQNVIPVKIKTEAGKIVIAPLTSKITDSSFNPNSEIRGKGNLKINILANLNGIETPYDFSFDIDCKTSFQILFGKIFIPLLILLIIILFVTVYSIAKKFMPVKIILEADGKKSKPVKMKIGKKVDFGAKPGLSFKLNENLFTGTVGQFHRFGADKWQIIPRDSNAFANGNTKIPYTCGSILKLNTNDGETISIKFKKFKK